MAKTKTTTPQYRALTRLSLRQSPDIASPKYEQWHEWAEGEVFTPPAHMRMDRAIERGIVGCLCEPEEHEDGCLVAAFLASQEEETL